MLFKNILTTKWFLENSKGLVLRGVAQQYALNWGGAAVPGGTSLAVDWEFTEE